MEVTYVTLYLPLPKKTGEGVNFSITLRRQNIRSYCMDLSWPFGKTDAIPTYHLELGSTAGLHLAHLSAARQQQGHRVNSSLLSENPRRCFLGINRKKNKIKNKKKKQKKRTKNKK